MACLTSRTVTRRHLAWQVAGKVPTLPSGAPAVGRGGTTNMSGLADILGSALGGDVLSKLAGQLGTDEQGAQAAIGVALPKILGQLHSNSQSDDGAQALANAVNKDHDGSLLDNLGPQLDSGATNAVGAKVLGKVFGDGQEQAVQSVAQETGLDAGKAAGLMGALAPMVLGALGKMGSQGGGGLQAGGLSDMLGGLLGGGGGGIGAMLSGMLGGAGSPGGAPKVAMTGAASAAGSGASGAIGKVTGMLDRNKDGSVIDDVKEMAKNPMVKNFLAKLFRR